MDTQWTLQDAKAAHLRGWAIQMHYFSHKYGGELRLNSVGYGTLDAWLAVANGANINPPDALCAKAMFVLRTESPAEYERIIAYHTKQGRVSR
jgi:hypothetical protein